MFATKKLLIIIILLLIIASCSSGINADVSKTYVDSDSVDLDLASFRSNVKNVNVHRFCYIKSGNVEHRNLNGPFFGIPIVIGTEVGHFGIGNFNIHLKGGGVRLTVSKIFRKTTYEEDVIVNVKGFIGVVQPTGGLSSGFLFGYSLITIVTP